MEAIGATSRQTGGRQDRTKITELGKLLGICSPPRTEDPDRVRTSDRGEVTRFTIVMGPPDVQAESTGPEPDRAQDPRPVYELQTFAPGWGPVPQPTPGPRTAPRPRPRTRTGLYELRNAGRVTIRDCNSGMAYARVNGLTRRSPGAVITKERR
jgi:hypothetical protein